MNAHTSKTLIRVLTLMEMLDMSELCLTDLIKSKRSNPVKGPTSFTLGRERTLLSSGKVVMYFKGDMKSRSVAREEDPSPEEIDTAYSYLRECYKQQLLDLLLDREIDAYLGRKHD